MSGSGVDMAVTIRSRGRSGLGRVYDLAHDGCLLGCGPGLLMAGTVVSLSFASGVRLNGRATLLHGSVAQIQFDYPLHDAVLHHLRASATGDAHPLASEPSAMTGARRGI